ncbi:MAG TPA: FAD:protein FMN transferase, partial [Clostridia bacterium]|nr:FAD:protein FMN transferase [Clostridia bacterium]
PYVRLWRFARKRKVLPTPAELASAGQAVGWRKLKLNRRARTVTLHAPGMRLDVGGIAKGYTADAALALLKARGINRALVAASGDIAIGDPPPGREGWTVGIAGMGDEKGQLARTMLLKNAAVSTSGDIEQFIEIDGRRYSHILNPNTGLGLTNRIQATVIARNATTTDALATITCILGPERGLKLLDSMPGVSGLVIVAEEGQSKRLLSRRFPRAMMEP